MKRLLRLYRDLWEQLYRIALTAGSTGRDFIRARLVRAENKISTNSVDQQSSLSNLHAGEAELPRVKVFRTALRLFGLKSNKQNTLRSQTNLRTTKMVARLQTIGQMIIGLASLYISTFRSTLSTTGLRFKSGLMEHRLIPIARLNAESSSLNSIARSVTSFCSRALVGTASVAKSIFKGLSFAITRMADAKNSLSRVRTQQISNFHGRPILGNAASAFGRAAELSKVFVQLTSYISVPMVVRNITKSYLNGRTIVGNVISSMTALKQTITTTVSVTTNKARNFIGKAEGLIFTTAHALIGIVAVLSASMQSFTYAICRLRDAPVSRSRGLAVWRAFIGSGRATMGQAQRIISGSRLVQILSNVTAFADQPLKITVQAVQHLMLRLKGLQLASTQSFPGTGIFLSMISRLRGLTMASVSNAFGVSIGAMAHINATIRDATTSARTAFSQTTSASCCILSVLSPADWRYPEQIDSKLYIWQVADAVQNGETLKLI